MTVHELKLWPEFLDAILDGSKKVEIRHEDDRDFHTGDTLILREYDPITKTYPGREVVRTVGWMDRIDGPMCNWAVMSLLTPRADTGDGVCTNCGTPGAGCWKCGR